MAFRLFDHANSSAPWSEPASLCTISEGATTTFGIPQNQGCWLLFPIIIGISNAALCGRSCAKPASRLRTEPLACETRPTRWAAAGQGARDLGPGSGSYGRNDAGDAGIDAALRSRRRWAGRCGFQGTPL